MPVAFAPFGADNDRAAGNAWMRGVNEPLGGGGGGVVAGGGGVLDGGGGGVLDGGGGVVEGGRWRRGSGAGCSDGGGHRNAPRGRDARTGLSDIDDAGIGPHCSSSRY